MKAIIMSLLLVSGSIAPAMAQEFETIQPLKEVLSEGTFVSANGEHTEGSARIEKRADGYYVVLGADFLTQKGPDLHVVLRSSQNVAPMEIIAPLSAFSGYQEYKLSLSLDQLQQLDQVVIYCYKFHVDFGIAAQM